MCTLDYLVMEFLFLVGFSWKLSLVIGSSNVGVMLFAFSGGDMGLRRVQFLHVAFVRLVFGLT